MSFLTREQRNVLKAMSKDVYGNANYAEKLLKKGEYVQAVLDTASGKKIEGKRLTYLTYDQVVTRMQELVAKREEAKAAAAATENANAAATQPETELKLGVENEQK